MAASPAPIASMAAKLLPASAAAPVWLGVTTVSGSRAISSGWRPSCVHRDGVESAADALVLFGATGDLASRMIFPALAKLVRKRRLNVPVIGVAKSGLTGEQLCDRIRQSLEKAGVFERDSHAALCSRLSYVAGDYTDPATFQSLREALGVAQRPLHYMAVPPDLFEEVVKGLDRSGCVRHGRLVVEKPFGRDLESARALNRTISSVFPPEEVYRIDHFLGKEPVQNIVYFRFANSLLEPV